jgi:ribonuclease HII
MVLLYKHPNHPNDLIIGVDEVARGCLFGRVYASAVLWNEECTDERIEKIKDSKQLSRKKRNHLRTFIEENATAFGIGFVDSEDIDEINILNASYKAMHVAINNLINQLKSKKLPINFNRILVDGNRFKTFVHKDKGIIPHTCILKGDNLYLSIAAASILAKEHHDQYINELCNKEPELEKYGLKNNQGYGTAVHYKALKEFGSTKYHRKSFNLHI